MNVIEAEDGVSIAYLSCWPLKATLETAPGQNTVLERDMHLNLLVTLVLFRSWQDEPSSPFRWDDISRTFSRGQCLTVTQ